ncbi:MAG: SPOR domain-containing protein [bacterium]
MPTIEMVRMTTYEIRANLETLRSAHDGGASVEKLEAPLRSMVSEIASRAEKAPLSIYLCSSDRDVDPRNYVGYLLAAWIQRHVRTALLVDCDFLSTGMSGIVPHRDALGFLDLLLYGTSLGVITQKAKGGVSVIGAGSFPVTKKSPFALDTFDNALRYLKSHSKCVLFCGPVLDDEDAIHPVTGHVDLTIFVNAAGRFREGTLDAQESAVASASASGAWSIRINTERPVSTPVPEPPRVEEDTSTLVAEVEDLVNGRRETPVGAADVVPDSRTAPPETPAAATGEALDGVRTSGHGGRPAGTADASAGVPAGGVGEEPGAGRFSGREPGRRTHTSRWLRVVTPIVAVFLIAVVVWWLYLTKSVREREQRLAESPGTTVTEPGTAPPAGAETKPPAGTQTPAEVPVQPAAQAADTTRVAASDTTTASRMGEAEASSAGTAQPATPPENEPGVELTNGVRLAERLDEFAGEYLVHVSSFRRIDRAKDEALYLMGWGYPVFLYQIDLGSKGVWYRVYVGPCDTREEALAFKIKLDENPRIQSTRIARVPG